MTHKLSVMYSSCDYGEITLPLVSARDNLRLLKVDSWAGDLEYDPENANLSDLQACLDTISCKNSNFYVESILPALIPSMPANSTPLGTGLEMILCPYGTTSFTGGSQLSTIMSLPLP